MHTDIYIYIHTYIFIHIHIYVHIYIYTYISINIYIHVYTNNFIYIHTYTYIHIFIYECIYISTYRYVYICRLMLQIHTSRGTACAVVPPHMCSYARTHRQSEKYSHVHRWMSRKPSRDYWIDWQGKPYIGDDVEREQYRREFKIRKRTKNIWNNSRKCLRSTSNQS